MFHFMRLGLTTEGAETPVRAARKEACERIRFAQLGRNSPTLDGRQMICGRGVDEWHEVRLPPSSFRAPRSGFPRFQWLTDLSTAPRIKCAPSPDRGIDNSALSAQMDLTLFVYTPSRLHDTPQSLCQFCVCQRHLRSSGVYFSCRFSCTHKSIPEIHIAYPIHFGIVSRIDNRR